jgi:hypothetical protein
MAATISPGSGSNSGWPNSGAPENAREIEFGWSIE